MAENPTNNAEVLDRLFAVIESRRGASPDSSYTAKLFSDGAPVIARKLGEEAVECLIASLGGKKEETIAESADVLYHLLVLWAEAGIAPGEVWDALARREGTSGIAEKASRGK